MRDLKTLRVFKSRSLFKAGKARDSESKPLRLNSNGT
jgi:hypothetical protein